MGPPLIPGLGDELTVAAGRLHRRRRRRFQTATAGALAVVFVGAMAVTAIVDAPPAAAGVEITERDGRVEVRLTDVETRPEVVEDALRDADIDAEVVDAPVGPSLVGRFVYYETADSSQLEPIDGIGVTFTSFSVPAGFPDRLELTLGRPARAGEPYAFTGNALSAGEPLACLDLLGRPARDLVTVAAEHPGVELRVLPGTGAPVPVEQVTTAPFADWPIVAINATAPDAVLAFVVPDGQTLGVPPSPPIGC